MTYSWYNNNIQLLTFMEYIYPIFIMLPYLYSPDIGFPFIMLPYLYSPDIGFPRSGNIMTNIIMNIGSILVMILPDLGKPISLSKYDIIMNMG